MEIWRARPLLRRIIVHSSFTLFNKTPQRSFQTLVRCPPVTFSSSQPQHRHPFLFFPQAPAVMRTLKSLSSEKQRLQSRVIPVKAYFICTDIDLKTLQAQNFAFNVTTPNSHSTNFAIYAKNDLPHVRAYKLKSILEERFDRMVLPLFVLCILVRIWIFF